ncbi:hypothetical protein A4D02_05090 [Niastella koreensis]|uniref:YgjP-like metallopeptidase domain-containing protein n=1 Tax=Niastella koreensis TaxID=354356 RepID=A0ABX3P655_9BACT|nr:hypothetical protein A4D02_05090 [Niastella koreensis]
MNNKYIDLYVRPGTTALQCQNILNKLYRNEMKELVPTYIKKWEKVMHVKVNEFGIKLMKTKWGTCNIESKRIWLNLELDGTLIRTKA